MVALLIALPRIAGATTCAGAITLNPASLPITNQALVCGGTNDLNSTNVPGPLCGTGDIDSYKNGNEALYTLTPITTGLYNVTVSGQTWSSVQVWAGCPTSGGTCIYGDGNSTASTTITVTLNAGTQYYIWFDTWPSPASPCPGTFSIGPPPPPPANDNPCGAINLPVNASCVNTSATTTNATATSGVPAPGCANYNGGDVWFSLTVPAGGIVTVSTMAGVVTDGGMALYTATACNGTFTLISCNDDANGLMPAITATGLTPGSTVYVRFWEYGNDNPGSFSICATTPPPPPANDNPCGATVASVNSGTSCVTQTPGTVAGATATGLAAAPCFGTPDNDVWFRFTAINTTHYISLNNVVGNTTDMYHAVYSGSCGSLTNISCSDADQSTITGLTVGATYWIRVYTYSSNTPPANTTFNLCITSPPPPPACGDIFTDSGGPSGNYPNSTNQITTICPGTPGDAVTLIFNTFLTEATYDVLTIYNGPTTGAPVLGSYSGSTLPPTFTSSHPSGCLTIQFTSDGSVNYAGWSALVVCQAIPSGDCVYALILEDSGNNGWGSSKVGVRINGGAWTYYTVTGSTNVILLGVMMGDLVEVSYDDSGPNQNQNRYRIGKLGQGPYFTSAQPPVAGITYSQIVTCGPPPAPPQDCAGGITVCSALAINNNATNWGETQDLNASNQGCLSTEHMGTWYFFSPQTAGNIGFSITPTNPTDDYDFAVWGPFASAQCPTGPPLRCSWNAPPSYVTGLGNGATDFTEGAGGDGWVKTIDVLAGQVFVMYIDNWSASGQAFTLTWQLSGGVSLDCTTLPIELLDLDAKPNQRMIDVTWATASELNALHYEVQRSGDNQDWKHLGTVPAAGNSLFRQDYLFVDQAPLPGINYYRLKQVDTDGTSSLTHAVIAYMMGDPARPVIFPNPAMDHLRIAFSSSSTGDARLYITDATGRTVAGTALPVARGEQNTELPIAHLAKGWYNLRVILPDGTPLQTTGFLKQ